MTALEGANFPTEAFIQVSASQYRLVPCTSTTTQPLLLKAREQLLWLPCGTALDVKPQQEGPT